MSHKLLLPWSYFELYFGVGSSDKVQQKKVSNIMVSNFNRMKTRLHTQIWPIYFNRQIGNELVSNLTLQWREKNELTQKFICFQANKKSEKNCTSSIQIKISPLEETSFYLKERSWSKAFVNWNLNADTSKYYVCYESLPFWVYDAVGPFPFTKIT